METENTNQGQPVEFRDPTKIPGNVRGYYDRTGDHWTRRHKETARKPFAQQWVLPAKIRITGQDIIALDENGNPDLRYPVSISVVQAGRDTVGGGHIYHLIQGGQRPRAGSLYVFASTKDERILEVVLSDSDQRDPRRAALRIANLMSDGDELLERRHLDQMTTFMFSRLPMSDRLATFMANLE